MQYTVHTVLEDHLLLEKAAEWLLGVFEFNIARKNIKPLLSIKAVMSVVLSVLLFKF